VAGLALRPIPRRRRDWSNIGRARVHVFYGDGAADTRPGSQQHRTHEEPCQTITITTRLPDVTAQSVAGPIRIKPSTQSPRYPVFAVPRYDGWGRSDSGRHLWFCYPSGASWEHCKAHHRHQDRSMDGATPGTREPGDRAEFNSSKRVVRHRPPESMIDGADHCRCGLAVAEGHRRPRE
jgi:hypothetical protein